MLDKIIYINLNSTELLLSHHYKHLNTEPMLESLAKQKYNWIRSITNMPSVLPYQHLSKPPTLATLQPGLTSLPIYSKFSPQNHSNKQKPLGSILSEHPVN